MGGALTVIGGGLGGLTAAVAAGEAGWTVRVFEARSELGGRARTTGNPYRANWGPHVVYSDGPLWRWLHERDLTTGAFRAPRMPRIVLRVDGRGRRTPPAGLVRAFLAIRRAPAPVDLGFREWASRIVGDAHAGRLAAFVGVATFDHDPGRLAAAFVHARLFARDGISPDGALLPGRLVDARRPPRATGAVTRCEHRDERAGGFDARGTDDPRGTDARRRRTARNDAGG